MRIPVRRAICALPLCAMFIAMPLQAADSGTAGASMVGKFGFDWLKLQTAKCEQVTSRLAAKFRTCKPADTASFTGQMGHHVCKLKGGEFLVFDSKARCVEEFETMQANAP